MEMRVASSREVLDDYDRGTLDAAIVQRHDDRRGGETILRETFGWMSAPDYEHRPDEPLRLASQTESCSVRKMAISTLDAAGIPWTEVFVGGGVSTIGAAVSAGLAVAALVRRVAPVGVIDLGPQLNLPGLPALESVLHSNVADRQARSSLRTLAAAIRSAAS
jgi:DNA-binding transcriptional LysR family regulator